MILQDGNDKSTFNDLQVQKMLKEQKQKELEEKNRKMHEEAQLARQEEVESFKQNSLSFSEMNKFSLIIGIFAIIMGIISLFNFSVSTFLTGVIGGALTIVVGKLSYKKNQDPQLTNTILWNLSQSLFDFIDLRIPFEIFSNKKKWLDMFTILSAAAYVLLSPTNIIYIILTIMLIISFLASFSMKDIESIHSHVKITTMSLFFGIIIQSLFSALVYAEFTINGMSLVLFNLFMILKIYTKDMKIFRTK